MWRESMKCHLPSYLSVFSWIGSHLPPIGLESCFYPQYSITGGAGGSAGDIAGAAAGRDMKEISTYISNASDLPPVPGFL